MSAILIVEDEPFIQMVYTDAIEAEGHKAVSAYNVAEGLSLAGNGIDAAILDVRLGDERVFPVAERLQALGVPFLFCSGTPEEMPQSLFASVPRFRKPCSARQVIVQAIEMANGHSTCGS